MIYTVTITGNHYPVCADRTQLLAAIFAYQLLVRYNYRRGNENGQVKWIMDCL